MRVLTRVHIGTFAIVFPFGGWKQHEEARLSGRQQNHWRERERDGATTLLFVQNTALGEGENLLHHSSNTGMLIN